MKNASFASIEEELTYLRLLEEKAKELASDKLSPYLHTQDDEYVEVSEEELKQFIHDAETYQKSYEA